MDKRIREGIEACRPGSDDLRAADMADVSQAIEQDPVVRQARERIEHWDRAILDRIDHIEVPAGTAERILARLSSAEVSEQRGAGLGDRDLLEVGTVPNTDGSDPVEVIMPSPSLWQRRHWAGASLSAIAAAALVVAFGYWLQSGSDLPFDQLASLWQAELTADGWRPAESAPANFPVPTEVRVPPTRWQWIGRRTPTPVVAYELMQGQSKAMLYVAKMSRAGLRNVPPTLPHTGNDGQAVGYWRSGDFVCVLVVPEVRSYRAFLRSSSAPLAMGWPVQRETAMRCITRISVRTRKIA